MCVFTTGEAVPLALSVARVPTRAAAFMLDLMIQSMLLAGLLLLDLLIISQLGADSAFVQVLVLLTVVTVLVGYPVTCETVWRGRTPGKFALGLRVVRSDGGSPDFRHAVTRGLAGAIVDFWMLGLFGLVAVISSTCSPQARRIGDVLAGTVVVRTDRRLPMPSLLMPSPWLGAWAAGLDVLALPDDLAFAIREYVARYPKLTPATQDTLGVALLVATCARLRTPEPQVLGRLPVPPVHALGAVLAERQRRTVTSFQRA